MSSSLSFTKPHRGNSFALVAISSLVSVTIVQASLVHSSLKILAKPERKRQSLLARGRTKDPGYFKNYGIRAGVPEEDLGALGDDSSFGYRQDSSLGYNMWNSDSMRLHFKFLDNIKPTAPMDNLQHGDGAYGLDAMYIPPYLNPDAFPTVVGKGCICQTPSVPAGAPLTPTPGANTIDANTAGAPVPGPAPSPGAVALLATAPAPAATLAAAPWAAINAAAAPSAAPASGADAVVAPNAAASDRITCECGKSDDRDHYTWMKDTPITGTNKYTLQPADITYSAGDYWKPELGSRGVVAPTEAMPRQHFPNQAPGDSIWPLPASAAGDRVAVRYARYLDQVQSRFDECDTVSKKCTVPCTPGDNVIMLLGNLEMSAQVTKVFVGNAAEVEFTPSAAATAVVTVDCPVEASCTAFSFCRIPGQHCVHQRETHSRNWHGMLVTKFVCPPGTQVCKTVRQNLMASELRKDGKACKAAAR